MVVSARQRSEADPEEYATATGRMRELAPRQPVFPGVELVRGADGSGINVSCRERAAAIAAWRAHAGHAGIRRHGLARWYTNATSSRAQGRRAAGYRADAAPAGWSTPACARLMRECPSRPWPGCRA